jgi:hypothetical protein
LPTWLAAGAFSVVVVGAADWHPARMNATITKSETNFHAIPDLVFILPSPLLLMDDLLFLLDPLEWIGNDSTESKKTSDR